MSSPLLSQSTQNSPRGRRQRQRRARKQQQGCQDDQENTNTNNNSVHINIYMHIRRSARITRSLGQDSRQSASRGQPGSLAKIICTSRTRRCIRLTYDRRCFGRARAPIEGSLVARREVNVAIVVGQREFQCINARISSNIRPKDGNLVSHLAHSRLARLAGCVGVESRCCRHCHCFRRPRLMNCDSPLADSS